MVQKLLKSGLLIIGNSKVEALDWNSIDMGDLTRCLIHLWPTPHGLGLLEMELQAQDETEIL